MLERLQGNNFFYFAKKPEKGAETSISLISSPDVKNKSGKYFIDIKESKSNNITYDESIAIRLWDVCTNLTNFNSL